MKLSNIVSDERLQQIINYYHHSDPVMRSQIEKDVVKAMRELLKRRDEDRMKGEVTE
jgi:hypothetical protein